MSTEIEDTRTPDEQMADRAMGILARLHLMRDELDSLRKEFIALGVHFQDIDPDLSHDLLRKGALSAGHLQSEDMKSLLRDVASKLNRREKQKFIPSAKVVGIRKWAAEMQKKDAEGNEE